VQARQAFEERGTSDAFMRWRTVLSGVGGASSDGASYCVMLMALHQMARHLFWWWRHFIGWRTFMWCLWFFIGWHRVLFGSGDALSKGAPSRLVVEELAGVASCCLVLVVLHHMTHRLF